METNKEDPECNLSHTFVQYPAKHFWPPEMQSCQYTKYCSTDDNIVKVCHNKIRVMILVVCYSRSQHNPCHTAYSKRWNKPKRPEHSRVYRYASAPHGRQPVKYFYTGWHSNSHRCDRKYRVCYRSKSNCKHMVSPYHEP